MAIRTDAFDLGGLHLTPGEGRRFDLDVAIEPFSLGGERYPVGPKLVPARLDVSRTIGRGYALRLRFEAIVTGPCMRCLEQAAPVFSVDAREVSQPGPDDSHAASSSGSRARGKREGDELTSPYVEGDELDLHGWARDALALALPTKLLCRADCAGLCAVCGANLNLVESDHAHEPERDPRWAKLSELRFE